MTIATNLGFPRIGAGRELKKAVEGYWAGRVSREVLESTAKILRRKSWEQQREAGIEHIPSNDFSFYDQMLDMTAMFGALPRRFGGKTDLDAYFAAARGSGTASAMEMTKWFDTNYHYIVPEFEPGQKFHLATAKPMEEFEEAMALGVKTRPVLIGPVTWLTLGKSREPGFEPLSLLEAVLPVYEELLLRLAKLGAGWVQIDEPVLVLDLSPRVLKAFRTSYSVLGESAGTPKICLATYFGDLGENLQLASQLPVEALHLDLVRAPRQLEAALESIPDRMRLSLGVVDGRNVWKTNLDRALGLLRKAVSRLGEDRVLVAPSCSLLHCPLDLELEPSLDEDLKGWLSFAVQKLQEITILSRAAGEGDAAVAGALDENRKWMRSRSRSGRIHNTAVQERLAAVRDTMLSRNSAHKERKRLQQSLFRLPLLPTTTIGSFPQTKQVRAMRARFKQGTCPAAEYEAFIEGEIERTVRFQESVGLDVLVHGESERNDMVEYFGGKLDGIAITRNGWVQSYGTRCVKPPLIFGDIVRREPMTVRWSRFAQSLTSRPVKGMLTGPVTMLAWSFVRDDQSWPVTASQIALVLRDEVAELEKAGLRIIQIDEPALREKLPLRKRDWPEYLRWATDAFRLATSGVDDATQIHTHMCYAEVNDIIEAIEAMDIDVISIEASRSDMEILDAFADHRGSYGVGPGVFDVHSPRVPPPAEMADRLRQSLRYLAADRLWVNPDCGLKTRGWPEVEAALRNMVEAAKIVRKQVTGENRQDTAPPKA